MTREEAIKRIKQNKSAAEYHLGLTLVRSSIENELLDIAAFNMAINALENERPKGHWITKWSGNGWNEDWDYTCSACGKEFRDADSVLYNSSYCPNCGAEIMVGGDEWRLDND